MTDDDQRRDRQTQTQPTPEAPQPERLPTPNAQPLERGAAGGGALTGETGVLSPESEPAPFDPAERSEIEGRRGDRG